MEKAERGSTKLSRNEFRVKVGNATHIVTLLNETSLRVDGKPYSYSRSDGNGTTSLLFLNNSVFEIWCDATIEVEDAISFFLNINGNVYCVELEDHRSSVRKNLIQVGQSSGGLEFVRAPMPGKVIRIEVSTGETVRPGTGLFVLEAMKMENELRSSLEGKVDRIFVSPGRPVEKGEILLSIKCI